jgi:hypothetical protein
LLVVLSPAKRLNTGPARAPGGSMPAFSDEAARLVALLRGMGPEKLRALLDVSPRLAAENHARFAVFGSGAGEKQAVELFAGDTYVGLEARTLDPDEMDWAGRHLRILSGLYGLLRPRDVIAPHRLQMGSRLAGPHGARLTDFWGDKLALALNAAAAEAGTDVLVNCASVEYFSAVDRPALGLRVITPRFLEDRPEGPRVMALWAKRARGAMARFIIQNRLVDPAALSGFTTGGYRFCPDLSRPEQPVFLRGG